MNRFLASAETATEAGLNMGLIAEISLVIVTILLTVATIGLWIATQNVHKDEIAKMTEGLVHDNDNMRDVALSEIHRQRVKQLRKVQRHRH